MENEQATEMTVAQQGTLSETASAAVAAQVRAEVEARCLLALKRPRNIDTVRLQVLQACKRTRFAEVARYKKPIGGQSIEGPSIRFVEEALRAFGNVFPHVANVYEDRERRIVRVTVMDLEANITYSQDVTVDKTVERRDGRGRTILSSRKNSADQTTYTVLATDDELLVKQNALVSKAIRTAGLRLLPGDIVEEAMDTVIDTLKAEDEKDPTAARKRLVDAFAAIGVLPGALAEYLGHELAASSPKELADLRAIGTAIKQGETTWAATMEARRTERGDAPKDPTEGKTGPASLGLGKKEKQ